MLRGAVMAGLLVAGGRLLQHGLCHNYPVHRHGPHCVPSHPHPDIFRRVQGPAIHANNPISKVIILSQVRTHRILQFWAMGLQAPFVWSIRRYHSTHNTRYHVIIQHEITRSQCTATQLGNRADPPGIAVNLLLNVQSVFKQCNHLMSIVLPTN